MINQKINLYLGVIKDRYHNDAPLLLSSLEAAKKLGFILRSHKYVLSSNL